MSVLQFLGQGICAINKQTNTDMIYVYLPSLNPLASGQVKMSQQEVELKAQDSSGQEVKASTMRSNSYPAKWKNIGEPNRITPPDVREGTPVLIYQVTGSDVYYWTTWGQNVKTHRLETVIYGWSANPTIKENIEFNLEDFYTLYISTHTGAIRLRTTQKNGEKTTWDCTIDAKNGLWSVIGGIGNSFILNDIERSLTYINKDKSFFNVNKKVINVNATDKLNINAGTTINVETKFLNINVKEKTVVNCPETMWTGNITQKGNYIQTGDYTQTGNYMPTGNEIRQGNNTTSGFILAGGGISSSGGAALMVKSFMSNSPMPRKAVSSAPTPGNIVADGNISVTGYGMFGGNVTAADGIFGNISYLGHKHGNGNNGAPTTTPQ